MGLRIVLYCLVAAAAAPVYSQTPPDAVVVSVKGRALVRDGKSGKPRLLKKDDRLFSEQEVLCKRGCKELKISYCNIPRPIPHRSEWTVILSVNCRAGNYQRGGAPRGEGIAIVSPRESEVVRPETFSLKWEHRRWPAKINLSLGIHLANKELWSAKGIDASKGFFEQDSLKMKLKEAQKAKSLVLVITASGTKGEELHSVKFKLISLEDQQTLERKLAAVNNESDTVLRYIGRGLAFSEYEVFSAAVVEIEKALSNLQGQNVDEQALAAVTELAITANYHVYNDERVRRLCSSLKSSAPPPFACSQLSR